MCLCVCRNADVVEAIHKRVFFILTGDHPMPRHASPAPSYINVSQFQVIQVSQTRFNVGLHLGTRALWPYCTKKVQKFSKDVNTVERCL